MSSYETLVDELQDDVATWKEESRQLELMVAQKEKLIEELRSELESEKKYSSRLEEQIEQYELSIEAIYKKQQRDRANTEVVFAVEHDLGEIDHEGPSYEAAKQAAEFYDDAMVVTRSIMTTDWQEVTEVGF